MFDMSRNDEFSIEKPVTSGEKALTSEQVKKLLSVIADINHRALIKLAISGGIRRSDIVSILSNNVNEQNLSVSFHQKKKKNFHTVFVSQSVMNDLLAIMRINKSKWLFIGRKKDTHLSSRQAYNILRKYTQKAGLPDIPFHALRATCIKICQVKGWSPMQTAKHVDDKMETIENHYLTPSIEERKETAIERAIL